MKILVVSQSFYPDTFASNDTARILVERGHKVTVLTGLPDYTTSEIPEEYKHGKNRHQFYFGAEVFRVPTIARKHGLEYEVIKAMDHGCTPDEALQEWDIYPYDNVTKSK